MAADSISVFRGVFGAVVPCNASRGNRTSGFRKGPLRSETTCSEEGIRATSAAMRNRAGRMLPTAGPSFPPGKDGAVFAPPARGHDDVIPVALPKFEALPQIHRFHTPQLGGHLGSSTTERNITPSVLQSDKRS
jgi:hypothetical protein